MIWMILSCSSLRGEDNKEEGHGRGWRYYGEKECLVGLLELLIVVVAVESGEIIQFFLFNQKIIKSQDGREWRDGNIFNMPTKRHKETS